MFCAYNLRCIINLVDKNLFKKFLQEMWLILYAVVGVLVENFNGQMPFHQQHEPSSLPLKYSCSLKKLLVIDN